METSRGKAQLFSTGGLSSAVASTSMNSIQTLAYLRVAKPPTQKAESLSVVKEEVEEDVRSLNTGVAVVWLN